MDNIDIASLRGYLDPSILEWLTEGEQSTSEFLDNCADVDEIFKSLPEAELAELECSASQYQAATSTGKFKTVSDEELSCLIENDSNLNTKRTTCTWLRGYKRWAERKGIQMDLADVPKEGLDRVLQQFYAELVKLYD